MDKLTTGRNAAVLFLQGPFPYEAPGSGVQSTRISAVVMRVVKLKEDDRRIAHLSIQLDERDRALSILRMKCTALTALSIELNFVPFNIVFGAMLCEFVAFDVVTILNDKNTILFGKNLILI